MDYRKDTEQLKTNVNNHNRLHNTTIYLKKKIKTHTRYKENKYTKKKAANNY